MSTKKQVRRERREQTEQEKQHSRTNPATIFLVLVAVAVVGMSVFAFFFNDPADDPPFPGAVWSPEHGHWH